MLVNGQSVAHPASTHPGRGVRSQYFVFDVRVPGDVHRRERDHVLAIHVHGGHNTDLPRAAVLSLAPWTDDDDQVVAVELVEPHSRSPGERRRWASRARESAVDAAYRCNMVRDFHPARRIKSPSLP